MFEETGRPAHCPAVNLRERGLGCRVPGGGVRHRERERKRERERERERGREREREGEREGVFVERICI